VRYDLRYTAAPKVAKSDRLLPQPCPSSPKALRAFVTTATSRSVSDRDNHFAPGTQSENLAPLFRKLRNTCIVQNHLQALGGYLTSFGDCFDTLCERGMRHKQFGESVTASRHLMNSV
jgi:hypothetical protein